MTPAQKIEFIEAAAAHGYARAVELVRGRHGPEVFASTTDPLHVGDRNARSSENQRRSATSLKTLYQRTARRR